MPLSLEVMATVGVMGQGGGGGVVGSWKVSPETEIASGGGFSHRIGEPGGESEGGEGGGAGAELAAGAAVTVGGEAGRGEGGGGREKGGREVLLMLAGAGALVGALELELAPVPVLRALRLRNSSGILPECLWDARRQEGQTRVKHE